MKKAGSTLPYYLVDYLFDPLRLGSRVILTVGIVIRQNNLRA